MDKVFLGIDTSNYMTSICFIDKNRKVLYEGRKLLEVEKGKKGLRQSEAVFQHMKNLPLLFKNATEMAKKKIAVIGVSEAPRPVEASYMPVFITGLSMAQNISYLFDIPLVLTTHQEGHIAAGLYSIDKVPEGEQFLAVHLSGGTSEFLYIHKKYTGYKIEKLGGTLDLHAGQLIDRIGVMLDCSFPAGSELEKLAKESGEDFIRFSSSIREYSFHLSGAEKKAKDLIEAGADVSQIARSIEHVLAVSVERILKKLIENHFPNEILLVGGVMQNQYIKEHLIKKLENRFINAKLFIANNNYSGDNAFGVANIALDNFLNNNL